MEPAPGEVMLRMYRQGLGDCFLLAFGTAERSNPTYVLIDCGVHMRQQDGRQRLQQVMNHLTATTQNHIDVVVATHEHADHLSGFVQKGSPFLKNSLQISQLWVAWTENMHDPDANRLRKQKATARDIIEKAVKEAQSKNNPAMAEHLLGLMDFEILTDDTFDDDDRDAVIAAIREHVAQHRGQDNSPLAAFTSRLELDDDGLVPDPSRSMNVLAAADTHKKKKPSSNELALGLLAAKAKEVRFCVPGETRQIPGVKGIRAYSMGPPKQDLFLKKDLPSKVRGGGDHDFKETYLSASIELESLGVSPALRAADDTANDDLMYPFAARYRRHITKDALQDDTSDSFFANNYFDDDNSWRSIEQDWLAPAEQLALHLDSDTNNTSLVLAFEIGAPGSGAVLLFPGDAQVGNWLSWREQSYGLDNAAVTADDLLRRTQVYKVGHHGSHNATLKHYVRPRSRDDVEPYGLELMNDIIALIPVDRAAADRPMPRPWRMPHAPLYKRLRSKSGRRVLRADLSKAPLTASAEQDIVPESDQWKSVPGKPGYKWRRSTEEFEHGTEGPLYYDILIPAADSTQD
jgi:beta-lactamase superfamily II metal-dependent hydrolase